MIDNEVKNRNKRASSRLDLLELVPRLRLNGLFILLIILSILFVIKDLGGTLTLAYTTDLVTTGESVYKGIIAMLVVMLLGVIISAIDRYVRAQFSIFCSSRLIDRFNKKALKLELSAKNLDAIQGKITLYTEDIPLLVKWFDETLPALLQLIFYIIGASIYSLSQNVILTILVVPIICILMPYLSNLSKKLTGSVQDEREATDDSVLKMREVFDDVEFIKAYELELLMGDRIAGALEKREEAERNGNHTRALSTAMSKGLSYLPGLVAAAIAAWFFAQGHITMGFLMAFIQMMMGRFTYVIPRVNSFIAATRAARVSYQRLEAFFNLDEESPETSSSDPIIQVERATNERIPVLEFDRVSFAYPGSGLLLKEISFAIYEGEQYALVGASGSGKSTVLRLILALYREQGQYQGSIKLLGREISDWPAKHLRDALAPVFQDSHFFQGSAVDNLSIPNGKHEADQSEALAEIHSLASSMGLQTGFLDRQLLASGRGLSGGERQRLAILRALIKDADLLLLDEPTSAVDSITADAIHELLLEHTQNRTLIQVSHELSRITHTDHILFFSDGRITEEGNHDELMAMDAEYARMYQTQEEEAQYV